MFLSSLIKPVANSADRWLQQMGLRTPWRRRPPLTQTVSLVVPCYNVGRYLDKFMQSLAIQTTGLRNVEIILVDDGSTDDTAERARRWARRLNCVTLIRQVNKGVSAARNKGLERATGQWVSLPDPDDYFDRNYLHHFNRAISNEKRGNTMVICNFVRVYERDPDKVDKHVLSKRFVKPVRVVPAATLGGEVHFVVNSAFMLRQRIVEDGLVFDPRIIPGFEDAHFINRYLVRNAEANVSFLREARYFYRKRADESSLQDTAKTRKELWLAQPRFGWIGLLEETLALRGEIPAVVQRVVLADLLGQVRRLVSRPSTISILSADEQLEYVAILERTLQMIDISTITSGVGKPDAVTALGLLYRYKQIVADPVVSILKFDPVRRMARIRIVTAGPIDDTSVMADGHPVPKLDSKTIERPLLGTPFYYEHLHWVSVAAICTIVSATGAQLPIMRGVRALKTLGPEQLRVAPLAAPAELVAAHPRLAHGPDGLWLIMDRVDKADDNGEHLYRHLKKANPEISAHFVLARNSFDWPRLERDGVSLIAHGSDEHQMALANAALLISSHANSFIRTSIRASRFGRFVFLQHGVSANELSIWFNSINPALLITAAAAEYESMVGPGSLHRLSRREVALTGMPRHDALLAGKSSAETIFIMPTWRASHGGAAQLNGRFRYADGFEKSPYFARWHEVLAAPRLRSLAAATGKRVVFCAHPNYADYPGIFNVPTWIETISAKQIASLQPHFQRAAVLVTDYSSVAFEAAYLDKPIVYYQFDREAFFREHIVGKGFFDFERDGFGPVALDIEVLLDGIEGALTSELLAYGARRRAFFAFRDGRASERVTDALLELVGRPA